MDLRSSVSGIAWPSVLTGQAAQLLALQYQFEATQWWPPEQLREFQFHQLGVLLRHAARTVPFHAARLAAAGIDSAAPLTEAAWSRLPVLTRLDVQRAGDRLHAGEIPAEHGTTGIVASGGSTGVPVRVRKSALDDLFWSAACIREEIWHRPDVSGTMARIRPMPSGLTPEQERQVRSPDGLVAASWGTPQSLLWHTGPMAIIDFARPIAAQVDFLNRVRPDYLFTDPSNLRLLLGYCRDNAIGFPSLRSVWTISEVLEPALRALCRTVLGVPIVHNYGAAEVGYIALQCPDHTHFHVLSEQMLVEVLNAKGEPCAPGETGRVVVTPLHNFAMPLLRYEIGDEAEVGDVCPCGRGLPVLNQVVGRTIDHLTLPSGEKRRAVLNHYAISEIVSIREYQIVQRAVDRIEAMIVTGRPMTEAEQARLRGILAAEFREGFRIDLTFRESIPRTAAGKTRPFISDLN